VPVVPEENATSGEPKRDDSDDDDEYGGFPDSLQDNVLAECDVKPSSIHATKPVTKKTPPYKGSGSVTVGAGAELPGAIPQKTSVKPEPESSGDEFDDDDFDLEAIEQTMKQTGENGQAYVCHS
jgi:DNA replication ATP-dependent helicase Dna2